MSRYLTILLKLLFLVHLVLDGVNAEIKLGWIGPLTGDALVVGVDSAAVAKRLVAQVTRAGGIAGQPVRLIVEDDQYQTANTLRAYQRLVHVEGVKVIFVLTYGGMLAVAPLAQRDGVLLLNPLDCDDELAALPSNSFCVAKRTEDLGIMNARHALAHQNVPSAIFYQEGDPFMPKVARASKDTLLGAKSEVVLFEGVSDKHFDFKLALLKARDRGAKSLFFYGSEMFGTGMKQARQLSLQFPLYALTNISSPNYVANAGDSVNGAFTAGWFAPRTPAFTQFLEEHRADVGREPLLEISTVPTYDLCKILFLGLPGRVNAAGSVNVGSLREYLYGLKGYRGLSGVISMDSDGAVRSLAVGMYRYTEGKYTKAD